MTVSIRNADHIDLLRPSTYIHTSKLDQLTVLNYLHFTVKVTRIRNFNKVVQVLHVHKSPRRIVALH